MQDFAFYIEDDRYRVSTLRLVSAPDAERARNLARRCLEESPHHVAVEVCQADRPLFRLARPAPLASSGLAPAPS